MKFKILVLDDEKDLKDAICRCFRRGGFETIGFSQADKALEYIQEHNVDLVCHGMIMPVPKAWNEKQCEWGKLTGLEFARRIREKSMIFPHLLCFTCIGDKEIHEEMKKVGIDSVLQKPAHESDLIEAADKLLQN